MAVGENTGYSYRVGVGYDVHKLVKDRRLILGGVKIDYPKGLLGHSDADVLTHAVMSAILGAMAAGSLGDHFPDDDPSYKDISSLDLLERVRIMMEEEGYNVENVDSMVICEKPKLAGYFEHMRMNLAEALRVPIECVSVKATTSEGLGSIGKGEGIAVQAVCLLKKYTGEPEKTPGKKKAEKKKKRKTERPGPLPEIKHGEIEECVVRTDGATIGNPGPSGIGIVIEYPDGIEIGRVSEYIGDKTNNQAEYTAAIRAAEICRDWGVKKVKIYTDSQLMERQMNGSYKVKNQGILKLYYELMGVLRKFNKWQMKHVPREENTEADKLSKLALQK